MTQDELAELIDAHQAETFRYLKYLGANHAIAEDLLQETFIRAFKAKNAPDIQILVARRTWLRRIAQNLFFDHCRRNQKSPVSFSTLEVESAEAFWESEFLTHNDGFDCIEALESCLKTLPERQQMIVQGFYSERRSRIDLAELFGISPDGIKMSLRRIRTSLGNCIQQRITEP